MRMIEWRGSSAGFVLLRGEGGACLMGIVVREFVSVVSLRVVVADGMASFSFHGVV